MTMKMLLGQYTEILQKIYGEHLKSALIIILQSEQKQYNLF